MTRVRPLAGTDVHPPVPGGVLPFRPGSSSPSPGWTLRPNLRAYPPIFLVSEHGGLGLLSPDSLLGPGRESSTKTSPIHETVEIVNRTNRHLTPISWLEGMGEGALPRLLPSQSKPRTVLPSTTTPEPTVVESPPVASLFPTHRPFTGEP